MGRLTELAPAKVNLTLSVTGRRTDGYHLLDSMVVFGPAADVLHGEAAAGLSLRIEGPFAAGLRSEADNLVLRAARALAIAAGQTQGAALVLEKHLPVASGIGGGSADAAAAIRLLCRLWHVDLSRDVLRQVALGLGADVPVCLASQPARMGGIGEELSAAPALPRCGLLLANPGIAVSTADVFQARTGPFSLPKPAPDAWTDVSALANWLASCGNDLEAPALTLAPAIGRVLAALQALPGCLLARMSGSGATCFGLFESAQHAQTAGGALPAEWWRFAGPLYEPA